MKKILIRLRVLMKILILISVATFFIAGILAVVFKPIYSVTLNGELIGYCVQKSKLQGKIDKYIESGDEENSNIAFVQIDEMPTYKMCLLKRDITTNDEDIFNKIKETGIKYYKYYAILEDNEEKLYVANFSQAEEIVQKLKDKDSSNIDNIQISEKYDIDLKDFTEIETAVASLYKEKIVEQPIKVATTKKKTSSSGNGSFSTSANLSKNKVSLGISLIKPISGTITSRFGSVSSVRSSTHTGLDISAPIGTPIKCAASGTVTWSGYKGSLGYLVVVDHGNQVQTYYAHCSKLYVSVGKKVSQGETIAAVGSTGNSTGPHLHLEIRVNGVAYNPQNYLY